MKILARRATVFAAAALCLAAARPARAQLPASNPFATPSPLPFQAPPFDRIKDSDYPPAIEEGMKRQIAEIDAIADNPQPPTFENTIVAMERSGELLTRVAKVFFNLDQSNTNDALQKIKAELAPKLAAHKDAIYLNPKLYARVKALYEKRDQLGLDAEGKYLIERDRLSFIRAGAELSDADKAKLTAPEPGRIEADDGVHRQGARRRPTPARSSVRSEKELAGLSAGEVAAAAEAAQERKLEGQWLLALQNTTQQPVLESLTEPRAARSGCSTASVRRGDRRSRRHPGDRGAAGRAARPEGEAPRLPDLRGVRPRRPDGEDAGERRKAHDRPRARRDRKARGEAARLQKQIDAEKGGFSPDGGRLGALLGEGPQGRVRPGRIGGEAVPRARPRAAGRRLLRGEPALRHHLQAAARTCPSTIRTFASGRSSTPTANPLALYYGDYFQRPSKGGGAWCDSFVDQSRLLGTRPVVVNNLNFTKPAAGEPALISFDRRDHALPRVRARAARHVPERELPDAREHAARLRRVPVAVQRALGARARGLRPLREAPQDRRADARRAGREDQEGEDVQPGLPHDRVPRGGARSTWPGTRFRRTPRSRTWTRSRRRLSRDSRSTSRQVPPRYHTTYFAHIWDGGYAAGYYAYLWAEVIDDDA